MIGTYGSFLLILGAAALVGQAIMIACGRRRWSHLAPAVGLAALCPLAWWTVRLPGEATTAAIALGLVTAACAVVVVARVEGLRTALGSDLSVGLAALLLASLPFIVEARFGILGTGLNPDMSQHLFAVDRLLDGASERLISQGYPLGPHSIVAAVSALGPSTVHAFGGLTLAVAVAACVAPLALLERLGVWRRAAGALVVGLAYLVAVYLVQGAFKETIEALFVLAFAIGLGELAREDRESGRARVAAALPLGLLAIGSVYTYSFPGLLWLGGAFAVWAALELGLAWRRGGPGAASAAAGAALPATAAAVALLVVAIAPEIGRMVDFANFETFNPAGDGLGNLFNRLSPLEALGIWPSGDFRVEPGDGAMPALAFYAGGAAGLAALAYGLAWWLRRGDRAVPAALGAALALWLYALLGGTPYQEAKALVLIAPLAALISVRALLASRLPAIVAVAFCAAAGGSSLLALANGPVGPEGYSPRLAELSDRLGEGSTLVVVADELVDDQHGIDYVAWELRGNRLCIESESEASGAPPAGIARTVAVGLDGDGAVVPTAEYANRGAEPGPGPCELIPDAARADPGAGG